MSTLYNLVKDLKHMEGVFLGEAKKEEGSSLPAMYLEFAEERATWARDLEQLLAEVEELKNRPC